MPHLPRQIRMFRFPIILLVAGTGAIGAYRYSSSDRPLGKDGLESALKKEHSLQDVVLVEGPAGHFIGSGTDNQGVYYQFNIVEGSLSRQVHFFRQPPNGGKHFDSTTNESYWNWRPAYVALLAACLLLTCCIYVVAGRQFRSVPFDGPEADYHDLPWAPSPPAS